MVEKNFFFFSVLFLINYSTFPATPQEVVDPRLENPDLILAQEEKSKSHLNVVLINVYYIPYQIC